jgi:hypothetical protein
VSNIVETFFKNIPFIMHNSDLLSIMEGTSSPLAPRLFFYMRFEAIGVTVPEDFLLVTEG